MGVVCGNEGHCIDFRMVVSPSDSSGDFIHRGDFPEYKDRGLPVFPVKLTL